MNIYLRKVASEGINHHVEHCILFLPLAFSSLSYLSCLPPLKLESISFQKFVICSFFDMRELGA